jgi:hypothetical protein
LENFRGGGDRTGDGRVILKWISGYDDVVWIELDQEG